MAQCYPHLHMLFPTPRPSGAIYCSKYCSFLFSLSDDWNHHVIPHHLHSVLLFVLKGIQRKVYPEKLRIKCFRNFPGIVIKTFSCFFSFTEVHQKDNTIWCWSGKVFFIIHFVHLSTINVHERLMISPGKQWINEFSSGPSTWWWCVIATEKSFFIFNIFPPLIYASLEKQTRITEGKTIQFNVQGVFFCRVSKCNFFCVVLQSNFSLFFVILGNILSIDVKVCELIFHWKEKKARKLN
jgi:hypothetical protein